MLIPKGERRTGALAGAPFGLSPGSALGSRPRVALSSAQAVTQYTKESACIVVAGQIAEHVQGGAQGMQVLDQQPFLRGLEWYANQVASSADER